MIFIPPGDDALLPSGSDRFVVSGSSNWKNIVSMFNHRLSSERLPQIQCSQYEDFVLCAALPQTLSSRVALGRNLLSRPDKIHFLNRKCGHCQMLSQTLSRSQTVWLNRGEEHIPEFVRRMFSDIIPMTASTTPTEFFQLVPFPHTRVTARQEIANQSGQAASRR